MANVPISAFTVPANTVGIGATGYSLTGSASASFMDLAGTWNTSGTPTLIKANVTDTASNAASLLMDLQVGGTSQFSVSKGGVVRGVFRSPATGTATANLSSNTLSLGSSGSLSFSSAGDATGSFDTILTRRDPANPRFGAADAAAPVPQKLSVQSVVAGTSNIAGANLTITGSQGTGTGAGGSIIFQVAPAGSSGTAQNALATFAELTSARAFNLYNTTDVTTNFERLSINWASNIINIGTAQAGTGVARQMLISAARVSIGPALGTIHWFFDTDNTGALRTSANNLFDIGTSASGGKPRNLFLGSYVQLSEMTAPAAPAANDVRIYAVDNGSGKTQLMALFATGAAQQIAIEP